MSLADLADRMSVAPARIAGLSAHGRPLDTGAPANLVLVDPSAAVTVDRNASESLSRNNPWHGRTLTGAVVATVLRGRVTAREGRALHSDELVEDHA
jgi:dihydroorotase